MRKLGIGLLGLFSTLFGLSCTGPISHPPEIKVAVGEVVNAVTDAIRDTKKQIGGVTTVLSLDTVTLTLATSTEIETSGEFKVFVVGGGSYTETRTQEITLELAQPSEIGVEKVAPKKEIYAALVNALLGAAKASEEANKAGGNTLQTSALTAEIGFTIKKSTKVGVDFEIGIVGISAGVERTTEVANKIAISFKKKK